MTVDILLEILKAYSYNDKIEIEIYDDESGKYLCTDKNPVVDKDGLDFVIRAKVKSLAASI